MQKKIFKIILILCSWTLVAMPSLSAEASAQNSWTGPRNVVWESKLDERISFLADPLCEGRAAGSRGAVEASFHIMRIFGKAGLRPFQGGYAQHVWLGGGKVGHNVLAFIPGAKERDIAEGKTSGRRPGKSRYIIVGAHYDGLGKIKGRLYPGADANASGVIAMTSLAEMVQARKSLGWSYPYNFIFVAFDGNQRQLAGSKGFWQQISNGSLKDPVTGETITADKIALMVNIDQIGSSLTPVSAGREDYLVMLGNRNLAEGRQSRLSQCNRFFGLNLELCFDYYGSKNFTEIFYKLSDQRIFIEHGIPSVLFTSGITMNTNRTWDKTESLNLPVLKKRIWLIFHWLENVL